MEMLFREMRYFTLVVDKRQEEEEEEEAQNVSRIKNILSVSRKHGQNLP